MTQSYMVEKLIKMKKFVLQFLFAAVTKRYQSLYWFTI